MQDNQVSDVVDQSDMMLSNAQKMQMNKLNEFNFRHVKFEVCPSGNILHS